MVRWLAHKRAAGSGKMRQLTSERHPAGIFEGPREVEGPKDAEADHGPNNRARRAVSQGIHADGKGQKVAAHDHDLENDLSPAENLLEEGTHANGLPDNLESISKVLNMGILLAELGQYQARVRRERA